MTFPPKEIRKAFFNALIKNDRDQVTGLLEQHPLLELASTPIRVSDYFNFEPLLNQMKYGSPNEKQLYSDLKEDAKTPLVLPPLAIAVMGYGDYDLVKVLLEKGAPVNEPFRTFDYLICPTLSGKRIGSHIAERFKTFSDELSHHDLWTVADAARSFSGSPQGSLVLDLIEEHHGLTTEEMNDPLLLVKAIAEKNSQKMIHVIHARPELVNAPFRKKISPLMLAVGTTEEELVQALCEAGADLKPKSTFKDVMVALDDLQNIAHPDSERFDNENYEVNRGYLSMEDLVSAVKNPYDDETELTALELASLTLIKTSDIIPFLKAAERKQKLNERNVNRTSRGAKKEKKSDAIRKSGKKKDNPDIIQ